MARHDFSQPHALRQTLDALKKDYITAYIRLHSQARLGVAEDKTKAKLIKDARLVALTRLATIELMPSGQLTDFQERLGKLKSCYQLAEGELAGSPLCPHCQFKPANESLGFVPVANLLHDLDRQLDTLLASWTRTLLDNLADPLIQANLELLKSADRRLIAAFVQNKTLPEPLSREFIAAVQEEQLGLTKEVIKLTEIQTALLAGSLPGQRRGKSGTASISSSPNRHAARMRNKLRFVVKSADVTRDKFLRQYRWLRMERYRIQGSRARAVPKNALETVSASANTTGGILVFGVKEVNAGFRDQRGHRSGSDSKYVSRLAQRPWQGRTE